MKFNLINFPCHHIFSVIINQRYFFFSAVAYALKSYFLFNFTSFFFISSPMRKNHNIFFIFICFNKCVFTSFFFVFTKSNKLWPVPSSANQQRSWKTPTLQMCSRIFAVFFTIERNIFFPKFYLIERICLFFHKVFNTFCPFPCGFYRFYLSFATEFTNKTFL